MCYDGNGSQRTGNPGGPGTGVRQGELFGAAALVAVFTVLQKVAGFVREQAVARAFGASAVADAYLVGLTLPELATVVAAGGVMNALIPELAARLGTGDAPGAWRLARGFLARVSGLAALLAALGVAAVPLLLHPFTRGWEPARADLAAQVARWAFPAPVLVAAASVLIALLHAHGVFAFTPLGRSAQSLVIALTAFALGAGAAPLPLARAYLGGAAVQFSLLALVAAWVLRRAGRAPDRRPPAGVPASPGGMPAPPDKVPAPPEEEPTSPGAAPAGDPHAAGAEGPGGLWAARGLFLPVVLWSLLQPFYLVVDRLFAPVLPAGAIAALTFSDKLRQFALQTAVWAVGTVSYPALAAAAAAGDPARLRQVLAQGLRLALLVALPVTVGLAALRTPIVQVVYERGAFGAADTRLTAAALLGDAAGVTAMAVSLVLAYTLFSTGRPWVPPLALLAGGGAQAAVGAALLPVLGPPALAWGASAGAFVAAALEWLAARRTLRGIAADLLPGLAGPGVATALMGGLILLAAPLLTGFARPGWRAAGTLGTVGAAALIYGALLWRLGVPEVSEAAGRLMRRMRRRVAAR